MSVYNPTLAKLMHKENAVQAKKFAVEWYDGDKSALYKLLCGVYQQWTLQDIDAMIAEIQILIPELEEIEYRKAITSTGFLNSIRHYYYPVTIGDVMQGIRDTIEQEHGALCIKGEFLQVDWPQIFDALDANKEYTLKV